MTTYTTAQGDAWDMIAHRALGSTAYTDKLIAANPEYIEIFQFPAGVTLRLPEIPQKADDNLPPWKR